jgi:hypothetical protein
MFCTSELFTARLRSKTIVNDAGNAIVVRKRVSNLRSSVKQSVKLHISGGPDLRVLRRRVIAGRV